MWNRLVEACANALSLRRIRVHAFLIAVSLWPVFLWNYSTPGLLDRNGLLKGTDFLHFYTIGTLAREEHPNQLYDLHAQGKLATERVPEAKGLVYAPFYGPQIALLFAPFSALSYGKAVAAWLLVNAFIYLGCCWLVWRACPNLRENLGIVSLAALAYPAFFHLMVWGQTSGLALACFTLMRPRGAYVMFFLRPNSCN